MPTHNSEREGAALPWRQFTLKNGRKVRIGQKMDVLIDQLFDNTFMSRADIRISGGKKNGFDYEIANRLVEHGLAALVDGRQFVRQGQVLVLTAEGRRAHKERWKT